MPNRSVAGLARNGNTYLVARRKPGGDLGGMWEFPGGKIEPGESPSAALIREFFEEFHVGINVGKRICTVRFSHGSRSFTLLAYRVDLLSQKIDLVEHREIAWLTPSEIARLDFAGSDTLILEKLLMMNDLP